MGFGRGLIFITFYRVSHQGSCPGRPCICLSLFCIFHFFSILEPRVVHVLCAMSFAEPIPMLVSSPFHEPCNNPARGKHFLVSAIGVAPIIIYTPKGKESHQNMLQLHIRKTFNTMIPLNHKDNFPLVAILQKKVPLRVDSQVEA